MGAPPSPEEESSPLANAPTAESLETRVVTVISKIKAHLNKAKDEECPEIRPWDEVFCFAALSKPESPLDAIDRFTVNMKYFVVNYAIFSILVPSIYLFSSCPWSTIAFVVLLLITWFFYFLLLVPCDQCDQDSLRLLVHHELSHHGLILGIILYIVTLYVLIGTTFGFVLKNTFATGFLLTSIHAAFRVPVHVDFDGAHVDFVHAPVDVDFDDAPVDLAC